MTEHGRLCKWDPRRRGSSGTQQAKLRLYVSYESAKKYSPLKKNCTYVCMCLHDQLIIHVEEKKGKGEEEGKEEGERRKRRRRKRGTRKRGGGK